MPLISILVLLLPHAARLMTSPMMGLAFLSETCATPLRNNIRCLVRLQPRSRSLCGFDLPVCSL
jgi:hypothetical protein